MKRIFIGLVLGLLVFNAFGVSVWAQETIDFEAPLTSGDIVSQVFGDGGSGPILVNGVNPNFPGQNAAMIYDSSCPPGGVPGDCSGGDRDLGTPNENFGGPGVGAGGASGPFANMLAQGNLLIVSEDLDSDDPDDADVAGASLNFDFSAIGSVTVTSILIIDVEPPETGARVDFFDAAIGGNLIDSIPLPDTGDNGVATTPFNVAGVVRMEVFLNGSGAIDDIVFIPDEPCIEIVKEVSVDGGATWFDSNDCEDTTEDPLPVTTDKAEYRFTVENCGTIDLVDVTIEDETLGFGPVNIGTLDVGEVRVFTKDGEIGGQGFNDSEFDKLNQPARCPDGATEDQQDFDNKLNTASATGDPVNGGPAVTDDDPACVKCVEPCIKIIKEVSVDGGQNWFDSNDCEDTVLDPLPVTTDKAEYRFTVENCGTIDLVDVTIEDETLGFEPVNIGTLDVGEVRVFTKDGEIGGQGFNDSEFDKLNQPARCPDGDTLDQQDTDNKLNEAVVTGEPVNGAPTVRDDDPACVRCVEPCIKIIKEVSVDGGQNWFDSNDCEDTIDDPLPVTSDKAEYRFTVENCGTIDLVDVTIEDPTLGFGPVNIGTLAVGEVRVFTKAGEIGGQGFTDPEFDKLDQPERCPAGETEDQQDFDNKLNTAFVTGDPVFGGPAVTDDDPACAKCEECVLTVDKKCLVTPPPSGPFVCDDKVDALKMIWNGLGTLQSITAYRGDVGAATLPAVISTEVINGEVRQVVTVSGYQPSTNDVQWEWDSSSDSGLSEFHLSCSDEEMNGPEDCGTPQGDGKNEALEPPEDFNVWLLDGLTTDRDFVLDCTPSPIPPSEECTFEATPVPGCKTDPEVNDLTSITFRYTGADCSASSNDQGDIGDKWDCDGVPGADPVSITVIQDAGKTSTDNDSVNVGDTFTLGDDFSAESIVEVGGQTLTFHTSCSQPLAVGDVFGSLKVVGINGLSPGSEVTYFYEMVNAGDTIVDVTSVFDSKLGELLETPPERLDPSESFTLNKSTFISETTENEVTVQGNIAGTTSACSEASDTVVVTVTEPTCEVSIQLDKIEDRKIKWKLSNPSSVAATIETLTITWPGSTDLKKVKYDGNDILKDVLLSSPATITSGEWLKEAKDRTVNPGDSGKRLELEFDVNFPDKKNQDPNDFDLMVTFEQGCEVYF